MKRKPAPAPTQEAASSGGIHVHHQPEDGHVHEPKARTEHSTAHNVHGDTEGRSRDSVAHVDTHVAKTSRDLKNDARTPVGGKLQEGEGVCGGTVAQQDSVSLSSALSSLSLADGDGVGGASAGAYDRNSMTEAQRLEHDQKVLMSGGWLPET